MRGLVIAAPASAQGKTMLTLGLLRAFRARGADVVSAKSGPDYIDPAFHRAATGRACVTLDSWAGDAGQIRARAAMQPAPMLVCEGAMGLFDGAAGAGPGGAGSAQRLAEVLNVPVVLVIDISHMAQSAVALVEGFAARSGRVAGVILNRAGSDRHADIVRAAVRDTTPVLGTVPATEGLGVPSRHLGLVQAGERADLGAFLDRVGEVVAANCNLDALAAVATRVEAPGGPPNPLPPLGQRIAVAGDEAFGFAYWHQVEDWRRQGAEILLFSPLADQGPAVAADSVYLPGGYPELYAGRIAAAQGFRSGVRAAVNRGALIYGECGGYMVLGDGLVDACGVRHEMLGLLTLETSFAERKRHLGYRRLEALAGPWQAPLKGHEFHYSTTLRASGEPLFRAADAEGRDLGPIGLRSGTVMGSFAHLIESEPVRGRLGAMRL